MSFAFRAVINGREYRSASLKNSCSACLIPCPIWISGRLDFSNRAATSDICILHISGNVQPHRAFTVGRGQSDSGFQLISQMFFIDHLRELGDGLHDIEDIDFLDSQLPQTRMLGDGLVEESLTRDENY